MNIKEWKKFSDLVDKENVKRSIEASNFSQEANKKQQKGVDEWNETHKDWFSRRFYAPMFFTAIYINKTEVNFWEWKAGKLKL